MTKEEDQFHIDFITDLVDIVYWSDKEKDTGNIILWIKATKEGKTIEYDPLEFAFYKYVGLMRQLDSITNLAERAQTAINIKMQTTNLIANIRIQAHFLKTIEYNFDGFYQSLNAMADTARMDLEMENRIANNDFIEKQTQLIVNQIQSNKISKSTNRYIAIFTGVAGAAYLDDLLAKMIPDNDCYNKEIIIMPITLLLICLLMYIIWLIGRKEELKPIPQK